MVDEYVDLDKLGVELESNTDISESEMDDSLFEKEEEFVSNIDEPIQESDPNSGQSTAFRRAAGEGLMFGGSDEAIGAENVGLDIIQRFLNSLTHGAVGRSPSQVNKELTEQGFKIDSSVAGATDLGDAYTESRDVAREESKQSQEEFPLTSLAGNIAGSIPSAVLTAGLGTVGKAGQLGRIGDLAHKTGRPLTAAVTGAKRAQLGRTMGLFGAEGGLAGYGTSEKEDIGGQAEDALAGAGMGAGLGLGMHGAGVALKGAGRALADTPWGRLVSAGRKSRRAGFDITSPGGRQRLQNEILNKSEDMVRMIEGEGTEAIIAKKELLRQASESGEKIDVTNLVEEIDSVIADLAGKAKGSTRRADLKKITQLRNELVEDAKLLKQPSDIVDDGIDVITGQPKIRTIEPELPKDAGKISPEDTDTYRKVYGELSSLGDDSLKSPESQYAATGITTGIRDTLRERYPQLEQLDGVISIFKRLEETTNLDKANSLKLDAVNKLMRSAGLMDVLNKAGASRAAMRRAIKSHVNEIKRISPKIGSELEEIFNKYPELQETLMKATSEGLDVTNIGKSGLAKFGSMLEGSKMNLEGIAKDSTNIVKNVSEKLGYKKLATMSRWSGQQFESAIDNILNNNKYYGPQRDKFVEVMKKMAGEDHRGRNAILFGMQQNPAYVEMLREISGEE